MCKKDRGLLDAFRAGLRGDPFPSSIESRKRLLSVLLRKSNQRWEHSLLKLPIVEEKYTNDELYEEMLAEEYRFKKGNPLSLLRCFSMAVNLKVCPPESVLKALNEAFLKVLAGEGTVKLDHLLGIAGKAQGNRNAFGSEDSMENQSWLTWVIFGLSEGCGLSVMESADRLSWFLERKRIASYTVESLIQQYSKKWKKRYLIGFTRDHPDHPMNWSPSLKSRLLQRFASRA